MRCAWHVRSAPAPESSVLVQAIRQLELVMQGPDGPDAGVPELLYRPFLDALLKTRGLNHG